MQSIHQTTRSNYCFFTLDSYKSKWFIILLPSLSLITLINVTLNYWILKSIHFRNDGLEFLNFHLTSKDAQVKSQARFNKGLTSKIITSLLDQPLTILNEDGQVSFITSSLLDNISWKANNGQLEYTGPQFTIYSDSKLGKTPQLSVQSDLVSLANVNTIGVSNHGSLKILNALETNAIKGSSFQDLRIESRTKSVFVTASDNINIHSKVNGLDITSFKDIIFQAQEAMHLHSVKVNFQSLPQKGTTHRHNAQNSQSTFQVCACEDGTIFLKSSQHHCSASTNFCENKNFHMQ